jgi:hypothetical protein
VQVRYHTKYPKIFDVYWGDFDFDKNIDLITSEVINNRNAFAEEFILKPGHPSLRFYSYSACYIWDHLELYFTKIKHQYVFVTSPYMDIPKAHAMGAEIGMLPYRPLYGHNVPTLIKVFNARSDFVSFWKNNRNTHKEIY